jgi:hypothetical protein
MQVHPAGLLSAGILAVLHVSHGCTGFNSIIICGQFTEVQFFLCLYYELLCQPNMLITARMLAGCQLTLLLTVC